MAPEPSSKAVYLVLLILIVVFCNVVIGGRSATFGSFQALLKLVLDLLLVEASVLLVFQFCCESCCTSISLCAPGNDKIVEIVSFGCLNMCPKYFRLL